MKRIIASIKYELLLFISMCMSLFMLGVKEVLIGDILYPLFLIDTEIGFTSRTLIGSLTGLIWEHPTKANAALFQCCGLLLTFLLFSLFLGGCIKKAPEKNKSLMMIIAAAAAVSPLGAAHFVNLFELLDIYWLMSVLICLFIFKGRAGRFLVPLFIVLGMWVHYSFLLAFMPVIYIMFFSLCIREKSRSSYIAAVFMVAVSVSITFYFMLNARNLNGLSFFHFQRYLEKKAGDTLNDIESYVGMTFRSFVSINNKYHFFNPDSQMNEITKIIAGNIKAAQNQNTPVQIIADIVIALPFLSFFEVLWFKLIRTAKLKADKFMYFLCLISPLVQFSALLMSTDTSRWCSLMLISQLLILFRFVWDKNDETNAALERLGSRLSPYRPVIFALLSVYACIIFVW